MVNILNVAMYGAIRVARRELDKHCYACGLPIRMGEIYKVVAGRYIHLTCLVKRYPRKLPRIVKVLSEKYGREVALDFLFTVKSYFKEKPHLTRYLIEAEEILSKD